MKKNLLKAVSILSITLLTITACQKNNSEKIVSSMDSQGKSAILPQSKSSGCQLTSEDFSGDLTETFSYNNNGLVEKFRQNYHAGFSVSAILSYLPNGHISRADAHWGTKVAYGGEVKEYALFTYQGNNITKVSWYYTATNELDIEVFVTYNAQNQLTRFEIPAYNMYQIFNYDAAGNFVRFEYYLDNFLQAYTNYDYAKYIKNPELLLVSSGLPFDFISPFNQDFPQLNSGRSSYYWDASTSSYVNWISYQSQNTVVTTNSSGNPEKIKVFDEITGKEIKLNYNYSNCGNGNQGQSSQSSQTDDSSNDEKILSKAERLKIMKDVIMARINEAN